jgi:hypothetical protein
VGRVAATVNTTIASQAMRAARRRSAAAKAGIWQRFAIFGAIERTKRQCVEEKVEDRARRCQK